MAETKTEYAARIAEKQRVDAEYNTKMAAYKTANSKNAATQRLTPEEIAHQQKALDSQKAAALRQQVMQQVAPKPVLSGWQSLLNVLGGQQPQQPPRR
jgi:hypothetical protein